VNIFKNLVQVYLNVGSKSAELTQTSALGVANKYELRNETTVRITLPHGHLWLNIHHCEDNVIVIKLCSEFLALGAVVWVCG
jgi:hypothetical protein